MRALFPVLRSFLFSGERTGEAPLALQLSGVVFEVGNLLASRERGQGVDTEIDTDGGFKLGQVIDGLVLAEQGYVPALGGIQGYRGAGRLHTFGSGRLHRMSSGESILARVNLPSAKRKPLRVNSAEPPERLRLKLGYLARLVKKLA